MLPGRRDRFSIDAVRRVLVALVACGPLLAGSGLVAAADEALKAAEDVVAGFHGALVEVAAIEPGPSQSERIGLLGPAVTSAHDIARMASQTVARRFWREFSAADQAAYIAVFERFTVANYASRFADVGPEIFEIVGSDLIREGQVDVHAVIHSGGDRGDVPIDYSLRFDGERFRIVSIAADGVNELTLMAAEHYAILETGTAADLIAALEAKLAEL